ncbi:hypothetical protein FOA43_003589 [Brettanomyces nanus]|uniref:Uncharacterized protein n=1 Tax=Eeniella nana TaxID=13502 RepID=A0A875S5K1_EENNA|nr:uncharacterized protein FOA43_003589 [Brettanomyces nanus]QPG76203.1 hypothetical protein FOA43_003589 [Brettanomyces nanus]
MKSIQYTELSLEIDTSLQCIAIYLPTNTDRVVKKQRLSSEDLRVEVQTAENTNGTDSSSFGGFCELNALDSLCRTVAYRVSESKDSITLTPLLINNSLNLKFQSLKFVVPATIRPNCVTLIEQTDAEDTVVLDIITEANLLITLNVHLRSLLVEHPRNYPLQLDNFYSWCSYSLPYSFLDRKPFFLKGINVHTSIAALVDGGVLLLSKQSPLDSFLVIPFSDSSYFESIKSRLFSRKPAGAIPSFVDIDGERISSKAVLDIIAFQNNRYLLSVSIDKQLKVWSLSDGVCLNTYKLDDFLSDSLKPVLISRCLPKKILHLLNDSLASLFLPIGNNYLKVLNLNADGAVSEAKNIDVPLPSTNWLFHSCDAQLRNSTLKIWICWCFGGNYMLQKCELPDKGVESWTSSTSANDVEAKLQSRFIADVENATDYESLSKIGTLWVLDSFRYETSILQSAMELCSKFYEGSISGLSLKEQILKTITANKDSTDDDYLSVMKRQWLRFANVCDEVSRSFQNIISVCYDRSLDENDGFFIIMKTLNYSIVKKASIFAALTSGSDEVSETMNRIFNVEGIEFDSLKRVVKVLQEFRRRFSSADLYKLEQYLYRGKSSSTTDLMTTIVQTCMKGRMDSSAFDLLGSLNSIPNCWDQIQFLANASILNTLGYKPINNVSLGNVGDSLILSDVRAESVFAQDIMLDIMLVLLAAEINDPMEELFRHVSMSYQRYGMILKTLGYSLDMKSGKLISNEVNVTSSSLVLSYIKSFHQGGALIRNKNLNLLTNDIFIKLFGDDYGYFIMSSLLALNADSYVLFDLLAYLKVKSPITLMLTGLVKMKSKDESAYDIFTESADLITGGIKSISSRERVALEPISSLADAILTESKVEYFFNLSILFESHGMEKFALKFALDSLAARNEVQDTTDDASILAKVFKLALKLDELELSYDMISKMKFRNRKHPIKQFIYKLFQINQLSKILEFHFSEDFDAVDELIYGLGESSALTGDLSNALKYYRTCYSLRLQEGDIRAAIEALYRINCVGFELIKIGKFSDPQLLLDNYLIVFNLLHTMKEDDRWIIKHPVCFKSDGSEGDMNFDNNGTNQLLTFEDLEEEYNQIRARYSESIAV